MQRVTSERPVTDAPSQRVRTATKKDAVTTETSVIPAKDGGMGKLAGFAGFVPVSNTSLGIVGKGRVEESYG